MVRTKQTHCGGSLQRPAAIQVAVSVDQPEAGQEPDRSQFEDIDEENWPDIDNLLCTAAQEAAQTAQASKSTGETSEGSKAVGIPPTIDPP